ncbi:MAG: putative metal-binding motif-containing protein [Myxococcota bacterium]
MNRTAGLGVWVAALLAGGCAGTTGQELDCDDPIDAYVDHDGDGFGLGGATSVCPGTAGYVDNGLDCDDADPEIHPGVAEQCNAIDDDCNGQPDNGLDGVKFFTDADHDGFGYRYPAQISCANPGNGWSRTDDDCDDSDPAVNPKADEVCNAGVDDDCSGLSDDADPNLVASSVPTWYRDGDADGFGAKDDRVDRCVAVVGYVADATDCDDATETVSPGAEELPGDGIDQNCNDQEGCFADEDRDGARTDTWSEYADRSCTQYPHAPASFPVDCDDTDPRLTVDVGWYEDDDGDGYGAGNAVLVQCVDPGNGLVPETEYLDCDDRDPDHNPATPEICDDGIDQNCNFVLDCDDPSCTSSPVCVPPCADQVAPSQVPLVQNGNTNNQGNDLVPSCNLGSTAPEVVIQWTPPATALYTIDLGGSAYDTMLYVLESCQGPEIACNDDFIGLQSQVTVQGFAGEPLLIVVDGFSNSSGQFTLNIN